MGAQQSTPQVLKLGYHVLAIQEDSPADIAGLEPFFDFIVAVNDIPLITDDTTLQRCLRENVDVEVRLQTYNMKAREMREVRVIPSQNWPGKGLLGASIRHCMNYEGMHELIWRVMDVKPNTPASNAGLTSDTDYIIGTGECLFRDRDDLPRIILQNGGREILLYVYNSELDVIRGINLIPIVGKIASECLGCRLENGPEHRIPIKQPRVNAKLAAFVEKDSNTGSPTVQVIDADSRDELSDDLAPTSTEAISVNNNELTDDASENEVEELNSLHEAYCNPPDDIGANLAAPTVMELLTDEEIVNEEADDYIVDTSNVADTVQQVDVPMYIDYDDWAHADSKECDGGYYEEALPVQKSSSSMVTEEHIFKAEEPASSGSQMMTQGLVEDLNDQLSYDTFVEEGAGIPILSNAAVSWSDSSSLSQTADASAFDAQTNETFYPSINVGVSFSVTDVQSVEQAPDATHPPRNETEERLPFASLPAHDDLGILISDNALPTSTSDNEPLLTISTSNLPAISPVHSANPQFRRPSANRRSMEEASPLASQSRIKGSPPFQGMDTYKYVAPSPSYSTPSKYGQNSYPRADDAYHSGSSTSSLPFVTSLPNSYFSESNLPVLPEYQQREDLSSSQQLATSEDERMDTSADLKNLEALMSPVTKDDVLDYMKKVDSQELNKAESIQHLRNGLSYPLNVESTGGRDHHVYNAGSKQATALLSMSLENGVTSQLEASPSSPTSPSVFFRSPRRSEEYPPFSNQFMNGVDASVPLSYATELAQKWASSPPFSYVVESAVLPTHGSDANYSKNAQKLPSAPTAPPVSSRSPFVSSASRTPTRILHGNAPLTSRAALNTNDEADLLGHNELS